MVCTCSEFMLVRVYKGWLVGTQLYCLRLDLYTRLSLLCDAGGLFGQLVQGVFSKVLPLGEFSEVGGAHDGLIPVVLVVSCKAACIL